MALQHTPVSETSLAAYFREQLIEQGRHLQTPPQEDTLCYLSNMLARFSSSDQVFSYDQGKFGLRPLALLYSDAYETKNSRERCLILRQLGDLALFFGALFPEFFTRRGLKKDYLVGMGGGAYNYLSENSHHSNHIFSELASAFVQLLKLVSRACSQYSHFDCSDILALHQRWLQSKDPLIAQQLQTIGIIPEERNRLQ